jgi:hypothetical protein
MTWEQLYPVVKDQAIHAVLRYEEPERRKDKIQELICQSYDKFQRDVAAGKEIKKQDFKCFVSQRFKGLDVRSFVKGGGGGTSTLDVLGFYRRRPTSPTPVVQYDDFLTFNTRSKQLVEDSLSFHVDYENWVTELNRRQKRVLNYLIQGYKGSQIAKMIKTSYDCVRQTIRQIQELFVKYFEIQFA